MEDKGMQGDTIPGTLRTRVLRYHGASSFSPPDFFRLRKLSLVKYGAFGPDDNGEMALDTVPLTVVVLLM